MTVNVDPRSLRYRVDGMDCPSCAAKIETAVSRFGGTRDITVNFASQLLAFRLDDGRTSPAAIEEAIRGLGYRVVPLDGSAGPQARLGDSDETASAAAWWQTTKGRLMLITGGLTALGAALSWGGVLAERRAFLPAALLGVVFFARRAWAGARTGTPFSIETLVTIATIGAIAIGATSEAAVVIVLFFIGELLEGVAAGRARAGIRSLADLVPRTAVVLEGEETRSIPAEQLTVDDIVLVRPGDRVPADGEVIEGTSDVDEAPVTGESVPVAKAAGSHVYAGSINTMGALKARVTKPQADNTIARIIRLVEEAQAAKSPTARFIDRFSAVYTPFAILFAALVAVAPPLLFGEDWGTWIYRGLALLLVACPCALVLSTPAAIASALASGARAGLLIKGGAALEAIGGARTIAFDKTGTLTVGRPKVTDLQAVATLADAQVLELAAAVEARSAHPIAKAILEHAAARSVTVKPAMAARAIAGKAVEGRVGGKVVLVASPQHAQEIGAVGAHLPTVAALEEQGKTVVVVIQERAAVGLIAVRDEPRPDAAAAIRRLQAELGVAGIMLTGDNHRTGTAIAQALGLEVRAELLPEQKLKEIAALKERGTVVMVGDGINDAPALAAANIGIAMGGGTDVALETADAALLRERVMGIADMVRLSRATLRNIKQNIAIALGLKAIFLVTTVTGSTGLWMAVLADTGATVLVTLNALRLLRARNSPP